MLPSEIIPRHEQGLHSRVVTQALGMAVRKPGERRKLIRTVRLSRSLSLALIRSSSGTPKIGSFSMLIVVAGLYRATVRVLA